jgi:hypothetical protein
VPSASIRAIHCSATRVRGRIPTHAPCLPGAWSGATRNWLPIGSVVLNPNTHPRRDNYFDAHRAPHGSISGKRSASRRFVRSTQRRLLHSVA